MLEIRIAKLVELMGLGTNYNVHCWAHISLEHSPAGAFHQKGQTGTE